MTNDNMNKIDELLKQRAIPAPSHNLSERIIAKSNAEKSAPLWQQIFMVPKPIMAVACVVILGVFALPSLSNRMVPQGSVYETQEYFASVMDDEFLFEAFDISSL
jgi:hypothetical protein